MKTGKNNFLLLIAGLLFITSVSADSIIHDHISEEEILIECQYNENKTVDINKNKSSLIGKTLLEKIDEDLNQTFQSPNTNFFYSRAPPKN